MANSVVKVTDIVDEQNPDSLLLLINKDGTVMPDRDTVERYLQNKTGPTDIQLMHIDKSDSKNIEVIVENLTYNPGDMDVTDKNHYDSLDDIDRILYNFKLDHDYTNKIDPYEESENTDTAGLSIAGKDTEVYSNEPPPLVMLASSKKSQIITNTPIKTALRTKSISSADGYVDDDTMILNKKYRGKKVRNVYRGKKSSITDTEVDESNNDDDNDYVNSEDDVSESEENNDDYDFQPSGNDSDFNLPQNVNEKKQKNVMQGGKSINKKSAIIIKSMKIIKPKRTLNPNKESYNIQGKDEKVNDQEKTIEQNLEELFVDKPSDTNKSDEFKSLEKKSKKKKEPPKSIPGDFALFSTPDIIRKVGGKEGFTEATNPSSSSSSSSPNVLRHKSIDLSPAKISQESRSKSLNEQLQLSSSNSNNHKSNRISLDGKLDKEKTNNQKISDGKTKDNTDKLKHSKSMEERTSITSNKSEHHHERRTSDNNVNKEYKSVVSVINSDRRSSDATKSPSTSVKYQSQHVQSVKSSSLQPISDIEQQQQQQQQELPNPDEFSNILTGDTKNFTTNTPLINTVPGSEMTLDGTGLDLDPSILDNIDNGIISEDILYQVAQQLVSNTELQNAIDKGINDGVLDTSALNLTPDIPTSVPNTPVATEPMMMKESPVKQGTQIIRPDGRILVLPPIERPTTRSRNKKKNDESLSNSLIEQSPTKTTTTYTPETPKSTIKNYNDVDDGSGGGDGGDGDISGAGASATDLSDDEEEEESEDDPYRLWCICNQPHNNRFMICCDTCEEWYHGKCVNITKSMGHQMELEGKEWICVFCKDPSKKRPAAAAKRQKRAKIKANLEKQANSGSSNSKSGRSSSTPIKKDEIKSMLCAGCKKPIPAGKNSIYCSNKCIVLHAERTEKVVVFERSTGNMLTGNEAPNAFNLDEWLAGHPGYEVLRSAGKVVTTKVKPSSPSLVQSKLKLVKNSHNPGVSLAVQQKGVNIGVLKHSAKNSPSNAFQQQNKVKNSAKILGIYEKDSTGTLKLIPPQPLPTTSRQNSLTSKSPAASTTNKSKIQTTLLPKINSPSTPVKSSRKSITSQDSGITNKVKPLKAKRKDSDSILIPHSQPNQREHVQKDLFTRLLCRIKNSDIKLSDEEVEKISLDIEGELYKCFGSTDQKYKTQYRRLSLNIKDPKNSTFWRSICEKTISSYELARMTHEGMASKEMAEWRESHSKRQLENIKKNEIELLTTNRQYVLKTHKGEEILEDHSTSNTNEIIKSLREGSTLRGDDDEKKHKDKDKHSSSSKHSHKDKKHSSRDKDHSSSSRRHRSSSSRDSRRHSISKDRSRHDRKRNHSRSSDRDRSKDKDKTRTDSDKRRKTSHKSSRHKKDDNLDMRSKEILEKLKKIVPPSEDRLWKHVSQEDIVQGNAPGESDSDHEIPSSTTEDQSAMDTSRLELEHSSSASSSSAAALSNDLKTISSPKQTKSVPTLPPPAPRIPEKKLVDYNTPVWSGSINMVDVAQISIMAYQVSGDCLSLGKELSENLDIVGRISPDTVWDYIGKMRCSNSKIISLLKLMPSNVEEHMPYLALYSYLSSRNRLGVVKCTNRSIKDFYILPLAPNESIPQALLPITDADFKEYSSASLLGIVVRDKRKRPSYSDISVSSIIPQKKQRISVTVGIQIPPQKSYTPPPPTTPPTTTDVTPSTTPPPPPQLQSSDHRLSKIPPPTLPSIITDLLPTVNTSTTSTKLSEEDEPYSPEDSDPDAPTTDGISEQSSYSSSIVDKYPSIPGLGRALPLSKLDLQLQMEELNKKIEMQKSEITSITKNIATTSGTEISDSVLANIAIPSNLHQILDSVKKFGAVNSTDSKEIQPMEREPPKPVTSDPSELTIPLMVSKLFPRTNTSGDFLNTNTIPLNLPLKSKSLTSTKDKSSVLRSLTEEDLIKKAAEQDTVLKTDEGNEEIYLPPVPGSEN